MPLSRNLDLMRRPRRSGRPPPHGQDEIGGSANSAASNRDTDIRLWTVAIPREAERDRLIDQI
jgi:hypothetical protein